MPSVGIHQLQLRYEPVADRMLLSVRTHDAEIYTAWLTRRMAARLHEPLARAVSQLGLPDSVRAAVLVPEAQDMLIQASRERPLQRADFGQRFVEQDARRPMGAEPLLPAHIELKGGASGPLVLQLGEANGRRLNLQLGNDLATALLRLLEQCLKTADWGLATPAPVAPMAAADRSRLN